jgi:uncharacterized protein
MIVDQAIAFLKERLIPEGTRTPDLCEMVINPNFTGVRLDNGQMGMAMNIRSGNEPDAFAREARHLIGRDGFQVLDLLKDKTEPLAASARVALVNALSRPVMTPRSLEQRGFAVATGQKGYSVKERVRGKVVTIVGFGGNVTKIAATASKVYVTELTPHLFQSRTISRDGVATGPFCAELVHSREAGRAFEQSEAVLLTGCTLVTGTMEPILKQCRGKEVVVYGITAGFSPEPLFERGVTAVATTIVQDGEMMADCLKNCGPMVERFFGPAGLELFIRPNNYKGLAKFRQPFSFQ